ncbi:MAG: response regulator transcription factor [Bryobacterales bacterium]|nr:response regulator transcription factor [Bryobacterales bacterium]
MFPGDTVRPPAETPAPSHRPDEDRLRCSVAVCDTQPVTAEGLRSLLGCNSEFSFSRSVDNLRAAWKIVVDHGPDVVVIDKSFGPQAILDWMRSLQSAGHRTRVVVWGAAISESEALHFLQAGAKGLIRKTADLPALLACIGAAANGLVWLEDSVFRDGHRSEMKMRSDLTPRERQVADLIETGLTNKEIAEQLGISPGTVKIHLKHIFEKTGVHGRYGLALSGMREKGLLTATES